MNTSYLSDAIPYRSYFVEHSYLVLNQNCIIDGLELTAEIFQDNKIKIKISPGWMILLNTPICVPDTYELIFDVTKYDDKNPILVFCHFDVKEKQYNNILKYRVGYYDLSTHEILPLIKSENTKNDLIVSTTTILLGQFNFKKELIDNISKLIYISKQIPDRNNYTSYFNQKKYNIYDYYFTLMPFDRISERLSEILSYTTGGSGGTGGSGKISIETGGIGYTGGSGGTGGKAGQTRKTQLRLYFHNQCNEDELWIIHHNLNQQYVFVTVYNLYNKKITPIDIYLESYSTCRLTFSRKVCGYAIIIAGPVLQKDLKELYDSLAPFIFNDDGLQFKGDSGDRGEEGIQGDPGIIGLPGCDGKDGNPGNTGLPGNTGKKGELGSSGCCGSIGIVGPPGEPGINSVFGGTGGTGVTGSTGDTGDIGPIGPLDEEAAKAFIGPRGEIGLTGNRGNTGKTGISGEKGGIGNTGRVGLTPPQLPPFEKPETYEKLIEINVPELYGEDQSKTLGESGIDAFTKENLKLIPTTTSFQFPSSGGPFYYHIIHEQPIDIIRLPEYRKKYIGTTPPGPLYANTIKYVNDNNVHPLLSPTKKYYPYTFYAITRDSTHVYDVVNNLLNVNNLIIKFHFGYPLGRLDFTSSCFQFLINTNVVGNSIYDDLNAFLIYPRIFDKINIYSENCLIDNTDNSIIVSFPYNLQSYVDHHLYCISFPDVYDINDKKIEFSLIKPAIIYFGYNYNVETKSIPLPCCDINEEHIFYYEREFGTTNLNLKTNLCCSTCYAAFYLSDQETKPLYGIENLYSPLNLDQYDFKFPYRTASVKHIQMFDHVDVGIANNNDIINANTINSKNNSKYNPILTGFYY